ncbi:hypothetical protein PSN13_03809 [Micromonospora saelicesensis]|uniref:Uncharacterized protein n=1 Tax=Micromonospora saelicesensis TaxID=285676 RepID=A0A328NQA5_9ACTN|nr:hypothetical protein PSN13_03809 [Micromonospora saelicesensis]
MTPGPVTKSPTSKYSPQSGSRWRCRTATAVTTRHLGSRRRRPDRRTRTATGPIDPAQRPRRRHSLSVAALQDHLENAPESAAGLSRVAAGEPLGPVQTAGVTSVEEIPHDHPGTGEEPLSVLALPLVRRILVSVAGCGDAPVKREPQAAEFRDIGPARPGRCLVAQPLSNASRAESGRMPGVYRFGDSPAPVPAGTDARTRRLRRRLPHGARPTFQHRHTADLRRQGRRGRGRAATAARRPLRGLRPSP